MRSMRGLSMNRIVGSLKKKTAASSDPAIAPADFNDSPEAAAHNNVKAFCESRGNSKDDEVLFLPPIVEAAESSPSAAAECARLIRKYLAKDNASKPSWQCNAIMLMRILADNPGPTFTRNIDSKFVDTAAYLLRNAKDPSVWQMMMDTLADFERNKAYDDNLGDLLDMWVKERDRMRKNGAPAAANPAAAAAAAAPASSRASATVPTPDSFRTYSQQNYFSRHHASPRLPDPGELASRLEEARTSAKLLEQVVAHTPPAEMPDNELIKEFADRCLSASRSIQGYMISADPPPDNDTMESLIDTNEQLQAALSQHQRAVLSARKQLGLNARPDDPSSTPRQSINGSSRSGTGSATTSSRNGKGKDAEIYSPPPGPPPASRPAEPYDPGRGRAPAPAPAPIPSPPLSDPYRALDDPFKDQPYPDEPFQPFSPSASASASASTKGSASAPRNVSSFAGQAQQTPYQLPSVDLSDDEDLYSSSPKRKEPMYRY